MAKRDLQLTFDSDYSSARKAHREILDAIHKTRFKEHAIFAIKLAVEEVLVNAIKHGNKHDASKKVHVEANVSPNLFEIWVEDEGVGFDPTKVPDPRTEENIEKVDGRGLLLIRSYMDQVEYTKGGRCVHMIKRNLDEPPHPPA